MDVQQAIDETYKAYLEENTDISKRERRQRALDTVLGVARAAAEAPMARGRGLTHEEATTLREILAQNFGSGGYRIGFCTLTVAGYSGYTAEGKDAYCVEIQDPEGYMVARILDYEWPG